jgi:cyclophilin family peptidyl-prolyl cis-trans isomerase
MNRLFKKVILFSILTFLLSCNAPGGSNENTTFVMQTTLGNIKIRLYDGTPIHRDNFIKLINMGVYEGISFHRVIRDFMIQAGDPETRPANAAALPDSIKDYSIPAEFSTQYFHKKGTLAAAREGNDVNPDMRSSGTQFYIVQGVKFTDDELNAAEQRINNNIKQGLFNRLIRSTADSLRTAGKSATEGEVQEIASLKMFQFLTSNKDYKIPEEQRSVYKSIGGTPRLDATYTVFGEVIEGLEVVDKIAAVQTDSAYKPVTDVKIIKIRIVKN